MNDYRTNWMLPALPLGPAIKRLCAPPLSAQAKRSNREHVFAEFDNPTPCGKLITEADCKQIKGAAQPKPGPIGAPYAPEQTPAAAPPSEFRVGSHVIANSGHAVLIEIDGTHCLYLYQPDSSRPGDTDGNRIAYLRPWRPWSK